MTRHGAQGHHDFELNLTPIIDCFVTLICFMLLSATYVNLVGMEAKVPIAVPASSPLAQKEPKFRLELTAVKGGAPKGALSYELTATGAGALSGKKKLGDLETLHGELVRLKRGHLKEFSIHFTSKVEMSFEELVKVMDATRNLAPKDGELLITDERNGKQVKVDVLFPDFIMTGNI